MSALKGARAYMGAHFGPGLGPIHLDGVDCKGTEDALLSCPSVPIRSCSHGEDAGVSCEGNVPLTLAYMYMGEEVTFSLCSVL